MTEIRREYDGWSVLQDSLGHRFGCKFSREEIEREGLKLSRAWAQVNGKRPELCELEALLTAGFALRALRQEDTQGIPLRQAILLVLGMRAGITPTNTRGPAGKVPAPAAVAAPAESRLIKDSQVLEDLAIALDAVRRRALWCVAALVLGAALVFGVGFVAGAKATRHEAASVARFTVQNLSQFLPTAGSPESWGRQFDREWETQEAWEANRGFWWRCWDMLPFGVGIFTFFLVGLAGCFWVAWRAGKSLGLH